MAEMPANFGGFVGFWKDDRAILVRYGEGKPQEGVRMTPLNILQVEKLVADLIQQGEAEGTITEEHRRQSEGLPTSRGDDMMPRDEVDKIAGEG